MSQKLTGLFTFIAVVVLLSLSSPLAYSLPLETSNYKIYNNPLLGFKFEYPSEWSSVLTQGNNGLWFTLHNLTGIPLSQASSMLGVFMIDLQDNKTMKQFLREYISGKTGVRYDTVKLNETKLGGLPAITAMYEVSTPVNQSVISKALTTVAIKDQSGYVLDYQAGSEVFDVLLPKINKILESFEFLQG